MVYLRNSKQRRDGDRLLGYSIETQRLECRRFINSADPAAASVVEVEDRGRPGGAGKHRPGRDRIIDMVERGEVDAVIAFKADRIGRNLREAEDFWNRCDAAGAVVAAVDAADLSDPVIRGVLFGLAERENQARADWARLSLDRRREGGLPPIKTGRAFGLRWDGDSLLLDPVEWPTVLRVFQSFDQGATINAIARSLSADRVPRRRSSRSEWNAAAVSRILHCTWYVGLVPDGDGFWNAGTDFLGDVDAGLWNRVRARLGERRRTGQNLDHVMSGLLFCAICGGPSPMSVLHEKRQRKDGSVLCTPRYRCIHHVNDRTACPGQSISGTHVERFLLEQLRAVLNGDELGQVRFARQHRREAERLAEAAQVHDHAIAQLEARRERLNRRVIEEGFEMDVSAFNAEMRAIRQELAVHEERRQQSLGKASLSRRVVQSLQDQVSAEDPFTEATWFSLPPARRNEFLRALFPEGLAVHAAPKGTKAGEVSQRLTIRGFGLHGPGRPLEEVAASG